MTARHRRRPVRWTALVAILLIGAVAAPVAAEDLPGSAILQELGPATSAAGSDDSDESTNENTGSGDDADADNTTTDDNETADDHNNTSNEAEPGKHGHEDADETAADGRQQTLGIGSRLVCYRPYSPGFGPLPYGPLTPFGVCVGIDYAGCDIIVGALFMACASGVFPIDA